MKQLISDELKKNNIYLLKFKPAKTKLKLLKKNLVHKYSEKIEWLEIDINGATDAIVFITSDVDITMQEVIDVTTEIRNASTSEIDLVYGTGFNIELQGELIVTVIATGFDSNKVQEATVVAEEEVPANPGATVLRTKGDTELPSWLANKTPRK